MLQEEESEEQHFSLGKFTPMKLPVDSDENIYDHNADQKSPLLEFSRYRLRVIEKLGEGNFGMVIKTEYVVT